MSDKRRGGGLGTAVVVAAVGWWVLGGSMPVELPRPQAVLAGMELPELPSLLPDIGDGDGSAGRARARCSADPVAGLDEAQMGHAVTIAQVATDRGLPDRAVVVGVATALQESKLTNHGHLGERNDHDSQGVFQQRPSQGWGTPEQVRDVEHAANRFFAALERVDGWEDMPLTRAAQAVQRSAYPNAYAQHEDRAEEIADAALACVR